MTDAGLSLVTVKELDERFDEITNELIRESDWLV